MSEWQSQCFIFSEFITTATVHLYSGAGEWRWKTCVNKELSPCVPECLLTQVESISVQCFHLKVPTAVQHLTGTIRLMQGSNIHAGGHNPILQGYSFTCKKFHFQVVPSFSTYCQPELCKNASGVTFSQFLLHFSTKDSFKIFQNGIKNWGFVLNLWFFES